MWHRVNTNETCAQVRNGSPKYMAAATARPAQLHGTDRPNAASAETVDMDAQRATDPVLAVVARLTAIETPGAAGSR